MERLDDLDDQAHEAGGREELAALLALAHRELAQEVLVDLAEGVTLHSRQRRQVLQQRHEQAVLQSVIGLGQHVLELVVGGLDRAHRVVDRLADVGALGQPEQLGEARLGRQVQHALGLIARLGKRQRAAPVALRGLEALVRLLEAVVGVAQEDQAEHRHRVFRGLELGVGAELVGGVPQALFDLGGVGGHCHLEEARCAPHSAMPTQAPCTEEVQVLE